MSAIDPGLQAHLDGGTTTLCRCWRVTRKDGVRHGFTDHDMDLGFDGTTFRANTGLTAEALAQTTGLSVDNSEAMGALSDAAITEADIVAGRYDGAAVEAWLVNWQAPEQRSLRFRGSLGEIESGGGAFRAELRGLAEALNRPRNRVYQALCDAAFGDAACGIDTSDPAYRVEAVVAAVIGPEAFDLSGLGPYPPGWFERGRCDVLDGAAAGLTARIKGDLRAVGGAARITLWEALRAPLSVGDRVRLIAGCDKRLSTCRDRFGNVANFRGFPHVPGDDWIIAVPKSGGRHDGGRRT